ncbi:MAG: type I-E CRISPR-associated protein Cse1/CasA [Tepidisphaeraceae bacterium]
MTKESRPETDWNVLTGRWLEVISLNAEAQVYSPLEALNRASEIRCIAAASPLDLFAAHRFLLTLLYWRADVAEGVQRLRESLLRGRVPRVVFDAIEAESRRFRLFDDRAPFLQDASARDADSKSAGSLFADFASGTNIAHFHHGDDQKMRLCVRCATIGMLRLVPWSQSGGAGLTPSVHNAPPVVAMAIGANLAMTLGLNLVPLPGKRGAAKWTGHFKPADKDTAIPYLEAFTWNPRRVHLLSPEHADACWRCGQRGVAAVGPIVYLKNEKTKKRSDKQPFEWKDPAAFYAVETPYTTMKSRDEAMAASGRDLHFVQEGTAKAAVAEANAEHEGWHLIVPCTNPANNKTFDHRKLELTSFSADAVCSRLPADMPASRPQGLDGWMESQTTTRTGGAARFVRAAARLLTHADWAALSAAAYREMQDSPAAFDVLSGLLWSLRGKVTGLPSRNVAWLVLKLMATVSASARVPRRDAGFCPLESLPRRQLDERRGDRAARSIYPVSFPRGHRLEADLCRALDCHLRQRTPQPIDWAGLCRCLDQLLD